MTTKTLTPAQAILLGALDDEYRTLGALLRTGQLTGPTPLEARRAAKTLVAKGLAEIGLADGIEHTGYRRPAALEALRADLLAAGVTAESPLVLDDLGEQMAREERWTEQ